MAMQNLLGTCRIVEWCDGIILTHVPLIAERAVSKVAESADMKICASGDTYYLHKDKYMVAVGRLADYKKAYE